MSRFTDPLADVLRDLAAEVMRGNNDAQQLIAKLRKECELLNSSPSSEKV